MSWPLIEAQDSLRHSFQWVIQKPNSHRAWDQSVQFLDEKYFAPYNDEDTVNSGIWRAAYEHMFYAAHDTSNLMNICDITFSLMDETGHDTVPVMLMNYNFHWVYDTSVFYTDEYFDVDEVNNWITHKPGAPDPFLYSNIFSGSIFNSTLMFRNATYRIDPTMIFTDQFTAHEFNDMQYRLQIDFGDGTGYHTINTSGVDYVAVTYPTVGHYPIHFRLQTTDYIGEDVPEDEWEDYKHSLYKMYIASDIDLTENQPDAQFNIDGLNVGHYEPCFSDDIEPEHRKAFIYVTGFDPFIPPILDGILDKLNFGSVNRSFPEHYRDLQRSRITELRNEGYDVYIVNYHGNNVYRSVKKNGRALVKFLDHLKCGPYLNSNEQFVIMGFSMGGLVTRYALNYMESSSYATECRFEQRHNTRLFISMDSPQQGANIPLSLQEIWEAISGNTTMNGVATLGMALGGYSMGLDAGLHYSPILGSEAAREMLLFHASTRTIAGSTFNYSMHHVGQDLYDTLSVMGGYPKYCKNVAVTQGLLNGDRQLKEYSDIPPEKDVTYPILSGSFDKHIRILRREFHYLTVSGGIYSNPSGTGDLIDFNLELKVPIIRFRRWRIRLTTRTISTNAALTASGVEPVCSAAGGYIGGKSFLGLEANNDLTPSTWNVGPKWLGGIGGNVVMISQGFKFNFIPMQSGIDYGHNWGAFSLSHDVLNDMPAQINNTPFDLIVGGDFGGHPTPLCDLNMFNYHQQRHHGARFRNEKPGHYIGGSCRTNNGFLVREIGDNKLWLENYELAWEGSFTAREEIRAGMHVNDFYTYPSKNPMSGYKVGGAYSKEVPMRFANPSPFGGTVFANFGVEDSDDFKNYDLDGEEGTDFDVTAVELVWCPPSGKKEQVSSTLEKEEEMKISVFPNPARNELNIKSLEQIESIKIVNLQGMLIYNRQFNINHVVIDLPSHLSTGVYQVIVQTKSTQQNFKIIKK